MRTNSPDNTNRRRTGNHNFKRRGNTNNRSKIKKELEDYVYYTGSNKHASDYKTMTDYIINYINGEFFEGNDIVESLK